MSQENERKQGIFVIAAFDRMFTRERKNQDGTFSKTHYVGLIIRSDTETRLCEVRTKHPEKYEQYKPQQIVSMQVFPRAFKDNIYYSDEAYTSFRGSAVYLELTPKHRHNHFF